MFAPYFVDNTATVDVEVNGHQHAIDTGFIVFNDRTYPHFQRLLAQLGRDVAALGAGITPVDIRPEDEPEGELGEEGELGGGAAAARVSCPAVRSQQDFGSVQGHMGRACAPRLDRRPFP